MIQFLTSILRTYVYTEDGGKSPIALVDENSLVSNIRAYSKHYNRLVIVANDPDAYGDNDEKLAITRESFILADLKFNEYIMLDARNKRAARETVSNADMLILSGGKCVCQKEFFNEIGLKELLKDFDGTVIGISAGTMNMCKTVANFPEELSDLDEPRWFDGMGFADDIIVPHYDGETDRYQFECDGIDAAEDYILPMSFERELLGLPNGSYIIIDGNGRKKYYGTAYRIFKGKSYRL